MVGAKRWGMVAELLMLGLLAACGVSSAITCGADVCVSDVRFVQPGDGSTILLFELTQSDGSIAAAAPPTFSGGLTIVLSNEAGDRRFMNRYFREDQFACMAGNDVPGAEGHLAAACLITLAEGDFQEIPDTGQSLMLTYYSETFPTVLREITFP
ncbi:MAG: hypothetical protein JW910_07665 [Anaerolineae bacterium]|nr:hypothetical protein [Anaerolineae bacterium]